MGDRKKNKKGAAKARATNGMDRRGFLIAGGGISLAAGLGLPAASAAKTDIVFARSSCGDDQAARRVLVAYGSRCGSTGEVAQAVAQELCAAGMAADVRIIREVKDLGPYQAVVVGSAVHNFKWLSEAVVFVNLHKQELAKVPVAYFMTCLQIVPAQPAYDKNGLAAKDDSVEARMARARTYLDPVLEKFPEVKPRDIGIFAGALDFKKLSATEMALMKTLKFVEGDFRDLNKVRAWAKTVAPALK
jgi:menaquinone-dependent protoporphyrinogen oxidase